MRACFRKRKREYGNRTVPRSFWQRIYDHQTRRNVRVSQLSQSLQMEEIDAVALAEPVQTASALRMSSLLHEKLPKVSHDPSLTRTSSSTRANVLGPKVQCFLSILTLIFPLQLSFFRLLLAIKHRGESKEEKKKSEERNEKKRKTIYSSPCTRDPLVRSPCILARDKHLPSSNISIVSSIFFNQRAIFLWLVVKYDGCLVGRWFHGIHVLAATTCTRGVSFVVASREHRFCPNLSRKAYL